MIRATWKLPAFNLFLMRQFINKTKEDYRGKVAYLWRASGTIVYAMRRKKVYVHRGNCWQLLNLSYLSLV